MQYQLYNCNGNVCDSLYLSSSDSTSTCADNGPKHIFLITNSLQTAISLGKYGHLKPKPHTMIPRNSFLLSK